jgi:hypothetical protein
MPKCSNPKTLMFKSINHALNAIIANVFCLWESLLLLKENIFVSLTLNNCSLRREIITLLVLKDLGQCRRLLILDYFHINKQNNEWMDKSFRFVDLNIKVFGFEHLGIEL